MFRIHINRLSLAGSVKRGSPARVPAFLSMPADKTAIRIQYFLYFGVMGVFLPYFNLYCLKIGLSGFQIGTLSAVRSMVLIVCALLWSLLADRHGTRRPIYILCSFVSAGLWSLFLFTTDFYPMLLVTIAYGIFYAPLISFLEAFAMDVLGSTKNRYGQTRAWGSVAFILVVLSLGKIIDRRGIGIVIGLVLVLSIAQALASVTMPGGNVRQKNQGPDGNRLFSAPMVVFLICAFLMLVSHGAYYGFFTIYLSRMGYGGGFIGICWALASLAEIVSMMNSSRLFSRFSFQQVLTFSFIMATLRWGMLYVAQSPTMILASQLLHAITYGAFHMAGILYMDQLAPPAAKTLGQAINNAVTYGLGLTVGFFASGALFESMGSRPLFLFSAATALIGGIIFFGFHFMKRSTP